MGSNEEPKHRLAHPDVSFARFPSFASSVPYSFDPKSGRPFGVAFFGTAFSDATLIKVAFAFEQLVVVGTGKQTTAGPVDFEAMARNVSQGKPKL